jgi:ABC-type uncharacterized transport system substrate-binding protein
MRRREFITLLAGAAATWPVAAHAQQGEKLRRIGILANGPEADAEIAARIAAFRKALQDLGWARGATLQLDTRFGTNDDELREKAKELVGLAPDVILAMAPPSVAALQKVTRTIPIVFAAVTDPVGLGIVQSLARPGGNVTGFLSAEFGFGAKSLELLKEIAPGIRKVIVFTDPENRSSAPQLAAIQTVAPSAGVELTPLSVTENVSFESRVRDLVRSGHVGLIALRVSAVTTHRASIIRLAAQYRLPAVYSLRIFVADGGLISYGPDAIEHFRQAASYVDRILKGEKPAELPVQAPTKYQTVVNLKTAKMLGFDVPATLLVRADEVIE